jgi:hypothetical protein
VMSVGDGDPEPLRRFRYRVGCRYADRVEAFGAGQLLDQRAKLLRRQKSSFS